jgi:sterol O-acyltransferase
MSSSTDMGMNWNGHANHDHILRPRAVKPTNPAILRAVSEDRDLAPNGHNEIAETGGSTTQTRHVPSSIPNG